jgi:hypothetical protein
VNNKLKTAEQKEKQFITAEALAPLINGITPFQIDISYLDPNNPDWGGAECAKERLAFFKKQVSSSGALSLHVDDPSFLLIFSMDSYQEFLPERAVWNQELCNEICDGVRLGAITDRKSKIEKIKKYIGATEVIENDIIYAAGSPAIIDVMRRKVREEHVFMNFWSQTYVGREKYPKLFNEKKSKFTDIFSKTEYSDSGTTAKAMEDWQDNFIVPLIFVYAIVVLLVELSI